MNKLHCLVVMFFTCGVCEAQNLVPNSSFEVYDTCPNTSSQIQYSIGWSSFRNTPDYFNACATVFATIPTNQFGYQVPASGNAYSGFHAYNGTNYKEIIGRQLSSALIIGQQYFVSFEVALDNNWGQCAINGIGAKFSTVQYSVANPVSIDNAAQVYSPTIISDTLNWTRVKGSFVADSAYDYIMIGSFFDDAHTDTAQIWGYQYCATYYFLDDVCVSTDSLTCNPSLEGINDLKNIDKIILSPNPFTDKIDIAARRNELVEINFFDVTGRIEFNHSFINSTTINTEQLAKGIYIYEVRNKNGVIGNGKVVKD